MDRLNDKKIRAKLHDTLLKPYHECPNTLIIDELGLKHGEYRADIAVLNGTLAAYEIKGETDTLVRFERQAAAYQEIFLYNSLVATQKHIQNVMPYICSTWGIYEARQADEGLAIKAIRKPKLNRNINIRSLSALLWKEEAQDLLQRYNINFRQSAARSELYDIVAANLSKKVIVCEVLSILKTRDQWRPSLQQLS